MFSLKILRILKEQVFYPHILLYKDALVFCINLCYHEPKECLTFLFEFLFCLNQQLFINQIMVPLIFAFEGFPVWDLICIESLQSIMKDVFQCLIPTYVKSSLKVYQKLFFKHIVLKHMHTYIYTQVCKNQIYGSYLSFLSSFVC